MRRLAWVGSMLLATAIGFVVGSRGMRIGEDRSTTSRLSPDETTEARLVEVSAPGSADRVVEVRLHSLSTGAITIVFHSPEGSVGGPPGTERLVWSKDGTKLLLVGRHFFVKEDLFLETGDQLCFLHDRITGQGWSNADPPTPFRPLQAGSIAKIEFAEPVKLKEP